MTSQDVNFGCTMCGRCCHGLRLRLSIDEAIQWIDKGGNVELLCEAAPVTDDSDFGPSRTSYLAANAFPARSGSVAFNISVIIAATFSGPCPFLRSDMSCGNYADRPRVCRIYPAEVSPFQLFDPGNKACPPEAWDTSQPVFQRGGRVLDPELRVAIDGMRTASMLDAEPKARLCSLLGIDVAAFANEGLMVHSPSPDILRTALVAVRQHRAVREEIRSWHIATNRASMRTMLVGAGCTIAPTTDAYIGFFPAEEDEG